MCDILDMKRTHKNTEQNVGDKRSLRYLNVVTGNMAEQISIR
jgi:hypothetical protein